MKKKNEKNCLQGDIKKKYDRRGAYIKNSLFAGRGGKQGVLWEM